MIKLVEYAYVGARPISGYIYDEDTNTIGTERVKFASNGFWVSNGRRITSYVKVDTDDDGYDSDGMLRQYSMSRINGRNVFFLETEDKRWW